VCTVCVTFCVCVSNRSGLFLSEYGTIRSGYRAGVSDSGQLPENTRQLPAGKTCMYVYVYLQSEDLCGQNPFNNVALFERIFVRVQGIHLKTGECPLHMRKYMNV